MKITSYSIAIFALSGTNSYKYCGEATCLLYMSGPRLFQWTHYGVWQARQEGFSQSLHLSFAYDYCRSTVALPDLFQNDVAPFSLELSKQAHYTANRPVYCNNMPSRVHVRSVAVRETTHLSILPLTSHLTFELVK